MKKLLLILPIIFSLFFASLFTSAAPARAQWNPFAELSPDAPMSLLPHALGRTETSDCTIPDTREFTGSGKYGELDAIIGVGIKITGASDMCGNPIMAGLLPTGSRYLALLYETQPSSREYIADILDNIGIPTVSSTYAQGTGYQAMTPFLPIWKVFRNLAYSLYIIMFIVIGVMIMLRTKVNAQTIISIQSALPNLLITLLLITFSYAIVGLMIDIMYFLIYFVVYLAGSAGLITEPTKAISRLLNNSGWSVLFEGRNSIVSAVAMAIDDVLSGLGTGALGIAGKVLAFISPTYLIVAIALAIAMIKLMFILVKSYIMLLVQLITAPVQILLNALPGSKAFSDWLKKTASYLIPFPVCAAMFIFAAVLIGDPTQATIFNELGGDANPFGVNTSAIQVDQGVWLPPFTLTSSNLPARDLMVLIGFFVFAMAPSAAKMAQDWMQVKESPYTAEGITNIMGGASIGGKYGVNWFNAAQEEGRQRRLMERQATLIGGGLSKTQQGVETEQLKK